LANGRHIKRRADASGFTLVEVVIALLVLAFVASLALLNAPPRRSLAQEEAETFAQRLQLTVDRAVLSGTPAMLSIDQERYQFLTFSGGEWRPEAKSQTGGRFRSLIRVEHLNSDPTLKNEARLNPSNDEKKDIIVFRIDPIGGGSSFSVHFGTANNVSVTINNIGAVSMERG